ncbi:MAG TPA: HYR domain-containing protein [Thermoanaerobaculia bacterium]|nr:HYR domain-containing protein [Thermoanaerobaculia bacterium]
MCSFASAATVTSIAPELIRFGNVEEFLTIQGTDLLGTESVLVTISGPAGQFVLEPNYVDPRTVIFWAPGEVLVTEGAYAVTLSVKNVGEPAQQVGPLTFRIETVEIFGPPLLNLPEQVIAEAENSDGAAVEFEVSAVSESGGNVLVNCTRRSGARFPLGSTPVLCTASDEHGTATGEFEVLVSDTVPPVLTLPDDFASETPVVTFEAAAYDLLDGVVPVTCSRESGSTFPTGVVEVLCEAYDAHFNHVTGSFKVTVAGGAPILTLPDDIFVDATSSSGAAVAFNVTASDGTVSCTPASGSLFAIGTTEVVCTANNASGSSTGKFNVTVVDVNGPVLALPADIIAEATSAAGAAVTFTVSAIDAVDGSVAATCIPPSGSVFPIGSTIVSCVASDLQGHETSGAFKITVRDTTAPDISSIAATPNVLWPPNHQMVPVQVTAVAFDAVDDAPISRIVSVRSNQPVNGTGDGDTGPDWNITGALTVNLRSERAGSADRVYTITVEATDASGNSSTREVTVTVTQSARRRSVR